MPKYRFFKQLSSIVLFCLFFMTVKTSIGQTFNFPTVNLGAPCSGATMTSTIRITGIQTRNSWTGGFSFDAIIEYNNVFTGTTASGNFYNYIVDLHTTNSHFTAPQLHLNSVSPVQNPSNGTLTTTFNLNYSADISTLGLTPNTTYANNPSVVALFGFDKIDLYRYFACYNGTATANASSSCTALTGVTIGGGNITVCQGYNASNLTSTIAPAGATTPVTYQWYLDDNPIAGPAGTSANLAVGAMNTPGTYVYKVEATNCGGTVSASRTIIVNPDPISQTINPLPNLAAVCVGNSVSATFSGGSGGAGTITDSYEYAVNGGTWNPYTPGSAIATNSTMTSVSIRTRRTATGSGCDNGAYNIHTWTVKPNSDVTIYVRHSNGDPVQGATIEYQKGSGSIESVGTTDVDGKIIKPGVTPVNNTFIATYNQSSASGKFAIANCDTIITFYTTAVTLNNYSSDGSLLTGVSNRYAWSGSTTRPIGDSATGTGTKEMFPGTYPMTSTYRGTSLTRNETILGNGFTPNVSQTLFTYTSRLTLRAYSHGNVGVAGVPFRYTAGGSVNNQSGNTDTNGIRVMELFAGSYTFNGGTVNGTAKTWTITIAGNGKTANAAQQEDVLLTRVKFHNAGAVRYDLGGIKTITGETYYMFPGDYTLRFHTTSGTESPYYSRTVSISGANFERAAAVIILRDHNGDLTPINNVRGGVSSISYHVGNVNDGNHISNESPAVWIDISPYNTNTSRIYEVTKNGTVSTQSKDLMVSNVFNFQTNLLTLRLQKCNADGISGGSIRWGFSASNTPTITNHWSNYPVTSNQTDANGNTSLEVFSGNFIFEMTYAASQQIKNNITITGNTTVTWQTTNVKLHYKGTGSSIAYGTNSPGTWWTYPADGQELLPGPMKFDFKDNGANVVDLTIPEQCAFEKTVVVVRLLDPANTPLSGGNVSYYEGGNWHTVTNPTAANGNTVYLLDGNQPTTTVSMNYLGVNQQKSNVNLASVNHVVVFMKSAKLITNPMIRSRTDANN